MSGMKVFTIGIGDFPKNAYICGLFAIIANKEKVSTE